jgi:N-acylneuraminate cytidylyltransferase
MEKKDLPEGKATNGQDLMAKNLCIIPARGGSKRIPRKNVKEFLGKPIIAYSIEVALKSGLFDEVMVSTDDEEIADVARKYGAKVPFMRSQKNANDYAVLLDVIKEVLDYYKERSQKFEYVCIILPTAPLIKIQHLISSFELIVKENADGITPLVRFCSPIQRALKIVNGNIEMIQPQYMKTRSQDLEVAYYDAGHFYWKKVDSIEHEDITKLGYEISETEAQDIDTEQDWRLAELKYNLLKL